MTAPLFHPETARALCRDPYLGDYADRSDTNGFPQVDENTARVSGPEGFALLCDHSSTYAQNLGTGAVYEAIDGEWHEIVTDPLVDAALALVEQAIADSFRSDELVALAKAAADTIDAQKRPSDHAVLRTFANADTR